MKLKLDENGNAVIRNEKPVYVKDDGSEVEFDVVGTVNTISRLNGEAKGNRERAEAAEARAKKFDGIDPQEAIEALKTVKNFDDKKFVDAGEVEKVKAEAIKAIEEKYRPIVEERDALQNSLYSEMVGGAFSRSKYLGENSAVPAEMIQAMFGKNFKVEDGKVIGYDNNGNKIYSPSNPGEIANFEESIQQLVGSYQYKDQILKGSPASGGGVSSGSSGHNSKTLTRAEFDKKSHAEKAQFFKDGGELSDS